MLVYFPYIRRGMRGWDFVSRISARFQRQEWKQRQLLVARRNLDPEQMKLVEMERRVKSVPDFGVTVGAGFNKFHRGTALYFYDFVVNSVCALLIGYPDSFLA